MASGFGRAIPAATKSLDIISPMAVYDLVADKQERGRVAKLVRRITDYIVDGGYTLRDIDGKPTLWGVWSGRIACLRADWQPERGSNSVEIFPSSPSRIISREIGSTSRNLPRLFDSKRDGKLILEPKLSAPSEFTYIDDQLLGDQLSRTISLRPRAKTPSGLLREPAAVVRRDSSRPQPVIRFRLRLCDGRKFWHKRLRRILCAIHRLTWSIGRSITVARGRASGASAGNTGIAGRSAAASQRPAD